jgi:hypothetical protein
MALGSTQSLRAVHTRNFLVGTLLGDFDDKVARENIFKPTIGNESLHEISNNNEVRVVNLPHPEM